jgi:tRNA (guanine37-N1)-methyltransferase
MKIDILTLFPSMFEGPFDASMIKRAKDMGLVEINIHDLRHWAKDKHKTVDDRPFGGGSGMIIRVDVVNNALEDLRNRNKNDKSRTILLSPQGKTFNQKKALQLSKSKSLILIAGHYEGFDERIRGHLVDEEISIGDYILTGGEIPAMVIIDSVVRLIPGVLDKQVLESESFSQITYNKSPATILDFPQYTRPPDFKGWKVPEVLLSGNHKEIERWRHEKALENTKKLRPELI